LIFSISPASWSIKEISSYLACPVKASSMRFWNLTIHFIMMMESFRFLVHEWSTFLSISW
jgi:hypothetical protein